MERFKSKRSSCQENQRGRFQKLLKYIRFDKDKHVMGVVRKILE